MSHKSTSEFSIVTSKGTNKVPTMIKTYHSLSKYILREYLEKNGYKYNCENRIQFMIDVIESQEDCFTLETCIEPLSIAIVNYYNIYKKEGTIPLSNRDKKQLIFLIKKILQISIEYKYI